jgi:hypothetical protein
VRALGRIALDGEHVGLNDDPLPRPFAWSAIAEGPDAEPPSPPASPATEAGPAAEAAAEPARGEGSSRGRRRRG